MKKILLFATLLLCAVGAHAANDPYIASNAILREAPAKIAAAYVTISNPTNRDDVLTGAKADWANHIQLHTVSTDEHGVMQMSQVASLPLSANGKIELKQGGTHLMIFGVKEKLAIDQKRNITLLFKNAGALTIPFEVQPIGNASQQAMHDHEMMDHSAMSGM